MQRSIWVILAGLGMFVGLWVLDDVAFGADIRRNVDVAGIDIGGLSRTDAIDRLATEFDGEVTLRYGDAETTLPLADLGVSLQVDEVTASASDRGTFAWRPFTWLASLVASRSVPGQYHIDEDRLDTFLDDQGDALFDLPDGAPSATVGSGHPPVDVAALVSELERVLTAPADQRTIDLPTLQSTPADGPLVRLVADMNELTAEGITVEVVGQRKRVLLRAEDLRAWLVFEGTTSKPTVSLAPDAVQAALHERFGEDDQPGAEPRFEVAGDGSVKIIGAAAGSVCCDADSPERIWKALEEQKSSVSLVPSEDPEVRGVAWAESLGIVELVGEFTTNYTAGQSRVTNIRRIAELTQGAVIEPGETFSVNDYVGRRTVENGFVSAGMILNGVFYPSVGGGISQYATTLFNAAFFAGLDFGEYQSHSIYLSRYPYGREATVSFPNPDLQITNNTEYGVLIWPTTTDRSITVRLYSTKTVTGEQTGQTSRQVGAACTLVTTERTRTWLSDQRTETDYVKARYRPEGISCDGQSSVPTTTPTPPATTAPPTTPPPTTAPPTTAPPTTVAPSSTPAPTVGPTEVR
jgi:vancomycin resistance protein YoaR